MKETGNERLVRAEERKKRKVPEEPRGDENSGTASSSQGGVKRKAEDEAVREEEEPAAPTTTTEAGVKRKGREEQEEERPGKYVAVEVQEDDSDREGPPDSECPDSGDEVMQEATAGNEDVVMMLMAMGIAREAAVSKERRKKEVDRLVMDFTDKDDATGKKNEVETEQGNNRVWARIHQGAPMVTIIPANQRGWEEVMQHQEENKRYWINICLLYTSPSPRDVEESRMPSSA